MKEVMAKKNKNNKTNVAQPVRTQPTKKVEVIVEKKASKNSKGHLGHVTALVKNTGGNSSVKAALLPNLYTTRYRAGWACEPTTVANPYTVSSVDVTSLVTGSIYEGGTYMAAISRDPLNAIIEYVPNPNGYSWKYSMMFCSDNSPSNTPIAIHEYFIIPAGPSSITTVPFAYGVDTNVGSPVHLHPHGGVFFAKTPNRDTSIKAIWFDEGNALQFGFFDITTGAILVTGSTVDIYRWDGADFVLENTVANPVANFTLISGLSSGWYSFKISTGVLCKANAVFEEGTNKSYALGHRPIPGILNRSTLTGIRVNGASVMVTPDSAELAKGGLCAGVQLGNAYVIESFFLGSSGGKATDAIISLKGSTQMDFHNGMYGWHKSMTNSSYKMHVPIRYNLDNVVQTPDGAAAQNSISNFISYMDPPDGWVMLAVTTPYNITGAGTAYPGGVLHTTWAWSVEYTTNDVWIGASLPVLGTEEYDEVMFALSRAPQFLSNSMHIRDLFNWLKSNVRTTGREGQKFLKTFGPDMQSALAGLLHGAGVVAGKMASQDSTN